MKFSKTSFFIFAILVITALSGCDKRDSFSQSKNTSTISLETETTSEVTTDAGIELTEDFLSGVWVDEYGFVCSYQDGVFSDIDKTFYDSFTVNANGISSDDGSTEIDIIDEDTISILGLQAVRAESEKAKEYCSEIQKNIIGSWHMLIGESSYGYEDISVEFNTSKMILSDSKDQGIDYTIDNTVMYCNGRKTSYIRIKDDVMTLFYNDSSTELYKDGSEALKCALSETLDASEEMVGFWTKIDEDNKISELSFNANGKVTVDGKDIYDYTALYNGDNEILIEFNGKKYTLNNSDYVIKLETDGQSSFLYLKDSPAEKTALKVIEIDSSDSVKKLLERYPDENDWIHKTDCGDIPLLADADYIDQCITEGDLIKFVINTPQELASCCYYINTTSTDLTKKCVYLEFKSNIDLAGYDWAPMGSTECDKSFYAVIEGNNYIIKNLTINNSINENVGFLGWSTFCRINSLNIKDACITTTFANQFTGVIAGQSIRDLYENCYVQGNINNDESNEVFSGCSMIGHSTSDFSNCSSDISINGEETKHSEYDYSNKEYYTPSLEVTLDENNVASRQEYTDMYPNLYWVTAFNKENVDFKRATEYEYKYSDADKTPGTYYVYLVAIIHGEFMQLSNPVSYTIE